uniref:Dysbindin domain-containing protein 1 n=3 Tax=Mus musculus TaxID=10090 RepID=H3BK17_MOUSE|eukprot:NP_001164446.2 dysbindin domain-containing protein 1 isoform 2 [Mus musculus]
MRCARSPDSVVTRAVGAPGLSPPLPTPPADPIGRMESPEGAGPGEIVKDVKVPQAALNVSAHETGDMCRTPVAEEEEEVGIPIPAPGFLQVTERRRLHPLSRASCLRSPSWTKTRAEQNREKQPPSDPERQGTIVDTFLTVEEPKED